MLKIQEAAMNPLKAYISNLANQEKEGLFFKMLKENKARLVKSIDNENPIEKYIKTFSEKKLFNNAIKGTFLNLKV